jgi:3-dehydroquinate synthetase
MTTINATYTATDTAFLVEGYEKIDFSLVIVDGAFAPANTEIADSYREFGRCLMVVDDKVLRLYGEQIQAYFDHHGIDLTLFPVAIKETDKSLRTAERIIDAFASFGLLRQEPVLVVGGGLTTDVTGFACSTYRRSTNYIRVPTTLIGLIDASVAIKVAVNHGKLKNRLGAFHPSQKVILDFSFLRTLPVDQVRNGMAELIKIAVVGNRDIFELLEVHGEELLQTRFGHLDGTAEVRRAADRITYDAIDTCCVSRSPTSMSSTWTGSSPTATPGAPRSSWSPRSPCSTATRSTSTWRSRPPWRRTGATSRPTTGTGSWG